MKICAYNFKGGVGKTTVSLMLALSHECGVITNDIYSPLEKVLPKERLLKINIDEDVPEIPSDWNVIFDLGGYVDQRVSKIIKHSDIVIIPAQKNFTDLKVSLSAIQEIELFNKNILIVVNRVKNEEEFLKTKAVLSEYTKYPVCPLKESKPLSEICYTGISLDALTQESKVSAYVHRNVIKQCHDISDYVRKYSKVKK